MDHVRSSYRAPEIDAPYFIAHGDEVLVVGTRAATGEAFLHRHTFDAAGRAIVGFEEVLDAPSPSVDPAREMVRSLYDQFIRMGDIEAFARVCDDDVVWEIDGPRALFFTGTRRGVDEVVTFWSELAARMDVHSMWLDHLIVRGDEVFAIGGFRSTANESGLAYSDPLVHVFKLRGDRVIGFREYFDPRITLAAYRPDLLGVPGEEG